MARSSVRRQMLYEIRQCMQFAMLAQALLDSSSSEDDDSSDDEDAEHGDSTTDSSDSDSDSNDEFEDLISLIHVTYGTLLHSRYIKDRVNHPRSKEYMYEYFLEQTPDDFRVITRMNKDVFHFVVDLIKEDPIFHNESDCDQAPVHWQLACALDRLGNDGQGVSAARSKVIIGVGHGAVFLYYRRVVHALCNVIDTFIEWPQAAERQGISNEMEKKGFRGAVGFVDGTTFPLFHKPSFHGNDYLDRKKVYSISAQVVCDSRHQIRHFLSGPPGSCHDSRVFSYSPLVTNPGRYFSQGQYLIADSAYATSEFLVPAYKRRQRDLVADEMEPALIEKFNTYLARARVVNEHTIGILKSRWSSLRGLRLRMLKRGDVVQVVKHTIACAILHNIALQKDPWEDSLSTLDDEHDDGAQAQEHGRRNGQTVGQRKRFIVRTACLAYFEGQAIDESE